MRSLEELRTFSSRVSPAQRRKRHLAEPLPNAPGVYVFRDGRDHVLYVGTSRDIRTRVRSYFTASETRTRMAEMVGIAERVDPIVCATPLEAEVRELRLIAEHKPRYNRRSRFPERQPWVKLTVEPFPRLSIVSRGPRRRRDVPRPVRRPPRRRAGRRRAARGLRRCASAPGGWAGAAAAGACALAEMGRCAAPCTRRPTSPTTSRRSWTTPRSWRSARAAMSGDCRALVTRPARPDRLAQRRASGSSRPPSCATGMVAVVRAAARVQRIGALAACAEIVAARRPPQGGWEIVLVRHGRLAGTTVSPRGSDPWPYVDALRATGEVVEPPVLPAPAATPEEAEKVLRWLEADGTRLVDVEGAWACPLHGAGSERARLDPVSAALRPGVAGFGDRLTGVAG